jgi:hypothetical protein
MVAAKTSISNPPPKHTSAGGFYNKHTCWFGESGIGRTSGGWKFPELTERNPGLTESASMFGFYHMPFR